MKRLCFLCPDVEATRSAVAAARRAGLDDSSLLVIARHDIPLDELRTQSIDQTDAVPGFARGLASGGIVGTLAGLVVMSVEELGVALGGAAIPLMALIGAGMGGMAGLLGGASVPSSRLKRFEKAIDQERKILLMIDVSEERAEAVKRLVIDAGPAIEFAGLEPHAPVMP